MSRLARPSGHKRQQASNDVDRISNLPESVRCHILSFLPTKEAVATSLLSKRWKYLWTNIHNLIFSDCVDFTSWLNGRDAKDSNIKYAHFVNMVLILLNQQTINKFSLEMYEYSELYDVTTWIAAAVARKVKVLEFCMNTSSTSDPRIKLPRSLFTCKRLEVLVLNGMISLNVPSLVCLPNLRTLNLVYVIYECDESVRNLISGCSSLETLYILRDVYDNVVTFTISSPTLRNLTIDFYEDFPFPEELNYKLEINAPALRYFHLSDALSRDFSVENLCSLEEADVHTGVITDDENVPLIGYDHYSKAVVKLLQGVHNVKHLSLSVDILEALSNAGVCPSFPRLTRLTVKAKCCKWNSLLNLVEGSNKLMFLSFSKDFDHNGTHVTSWSKPEKVPICLTSCLKTMSFHGFAGLEDELAMVAYILENAKVLRTMIIKAADPLDLETRFQLFQKVAKFPRGSVECEITFS